jgi:hypothetical protein
VLATVGVRPPVIEYSEDEFQVSSRTNFEHRHFKFEGHRQPSSVHVHFVGAHALSFGDDIRWEDGDWVEIRFDDFGRGLRNSVCIRRKTEYKLIKVEAMS